MFYLITFLLNGVNSCDKNSSEYTKCIDKLFNLDYLEKLKKKHKDLEEINMEDIIKKKSKLLKIFSQIKNVENELLNDDIEDSDNGDPMVR